METSNAWVKGQRCPKCGGRRGKVIAYNLVERSGQYGTYRYHRFTHRVELKERRTIKSGSRKGYSYSLKKRKYCYVPVEILQVTRGPKVKSGPSRRDAPAGPHSK